MTEKLCSKCQTYKHASSFHKNSKQKDGLARWCKQCVRINSKKWYDARPRQERLEIKRAWQDRNREYVNAYNNQWRKDNPDKHAAQEAKRRASKSNATPSWLSPEHLAHIKRFYKLAKLMEDITGDKHHVDHVVPLKGENVCGLHVPWNLQVLPAKINLKKSNNFEGGVL